MNPERVEPLGSASAPSAGLLAREGGRVLLWARTTAERDGRLASQVLDPSPDAWLRAVAAEALAGPVASLVAISIEPERVVVLASGDVRVETRTGATAAADLVDGSSSLTVVERVLALPLRSIRAHLGEPHHAGGDATTRLGSGVVPAAGALVAWEELPVAAPPAPAAAPTSCGCGRAPAPQVGSAGVAEAAVPVTTVATSVVCASGHLNALETIYCTTCGIGMAQSGATSTLRPSSPATDPHASHHGVLVVDDGTVLPVRRPVVCGSAPETHADVRAGRADGVRIPGTDPVHCRFSVHAGRVHVHHVGGAALAVRTGQDPTWHSLGAGGVAALASDSVLALGHRQVRFVGEPALAAA